MAEPEAQKTESEALQAFRAAYEEAHRAWNEGDFKRAYGGLPEDFEYHLAPTWPNARPLRGPDEIVAFFEDWRETFPDTRSEPESFEFIEADERTMIVGFRVTGTGSRSGVGTAMDLWQVWEMREVTEPLPAGIATGLGLVPLQVREYSSRRDALEAAGIEEPGTREA